MAEDRDDSQEKTQDPTQRRLDKAREDGKVLSSKEIFVFTSLFAGILIFYMTTYFIEDFLKIFKSLFVFGKELNSGKNLIFSFSEVISLILKVFLVFAIPLLIVSIITQFLVGGINFSLKAIYWKFEKINPIKGLKRIFSIKGLVELVKAILNAAPDIEIKSRRVGSSVYQVPIPLSDSSKIKTGIRILLEAARLRKQSNIILKLSAEIIDAYNNKGVAVKKKEDLHKLSELNKSFSHFNW